jgi:carbon monoxide dehydrogenase subunit G
MLQFEGAKDFPRHAPQELWAKLSDARFLVQCIPDVHEVKQATAEQAVCILRPGLAFVRGTLELTLRVVEATAPASVRVSLATKGIGTTSAVEVALALVAQDSGTRVGWAAEVKSLGGLLKAVPQGLIRGAAQKVINDAWASVAKQLDQAG